MIITRQVPQDQWRRVLDDLSRVHAGATVRLQVLDDQGLKFYGDALRLVGLASDGVAGRESISAMLEAGPNAHLTHVVDSPCAMHVEQQWEPRTANIQVTGKDGRRTLICLGPPVLADGGRKHPAGRRGSSALVPCRRPS
jgi:hypothetical protein